MTIELPAGLRVEHTIVHPNINGATLVCGVERVSVDGPGQNNQVSLTSRIEWVASIHLPPAAMKHLRNQLNAIIEGWETEFGPIPQKLPPPQAKPVLQLVPTKTGPLEGYFRHLAPNLERRLEMEGLVDPWASNAQFVSAGHQDRHPLSAEDHQTESARSQSSPTASPEPSPQPGEQTACDPHRSPDP